jgi:ADP-heptose:LPS heptosyltransferase
MKILLIGHNRIGDTILSTGLINFFLNKYENSLFTIVTSSISACIFENMPKLERLIISNKEKYSLHWLNIWLQTKSIKWDLIIDLRSSALVYFLNYKQKMIFKGNKFDHKLYQLQKFIGSSDEITPVIWANKNNYEGIHEKKNLNNKYICIAPMSNSAAKDWSMENYISLFENDLFNSYDIVLLGATSNIRELNIINKFIKKSNHQIKNLINDANMIETYFILKKADLFLGSDSSNMHLAVVANIPTIGLFGPTDEKLYGPLGKNNLSIRGDKSFSEIVNQLDYKSGRIKSYLDDLSVTKVYREIERILISK